MNQAAYQNYVSKQRLTIGTCAYVRHIWKLILAFLQAQRLLAE